MASANADGAARRALHVTIQFRNNVRAPAEESRSRERCRRTYHRGVSDLVRRVEEKITHHRLLDDGDAVIVAVSGGVDSMILLHVLHMLGAKHRWKLIVAHFNHCLRGKESDADERLVARTAKKLGLRFESASADVKQFARERKLSIEMAARTLRHHFLARTASALGIRKVALAHHADDQVELFFIRLLRGASPQGLGGMKWITPSPADWDITLVRPLLAETKLALISCACDARIRFREDATNRSADILRNRIRRHLLPRLRRDFQPEIDQVVLRNMEILRAEAEFVNAEAAAWLKRRHREAFDALPVAVQRCVIETELLGLGLMPQFELVERLRLNTARWFPVGTDAACRRRPDGRLEKRAAELPPFQKHETLLILGRRVGETVFQSRRFRWRLLPGGKLPARRAPHTEFFDAGTVGDRIVLRHWQPGDRFQPIGMQCAVKLQDLFVNQKVPRERRRQLVVATTTHCEIFWVEELRIGERFKVTSATQQILRWNWSQ